MARGFAFAMLGAALLWPAAAQAQGFEYDCDTSPEHFSELKAPPHAGPRSISGSITFHAMYRSSKYLAVANIRLGDSARNEVWWARISVMGQPRDSKDALTAVLRVKRPEDAEAREVAFGSFKVGEVIPFSLGVDAEGKGRARLGDRAITFTLPAGQSMEATAVCSTADVLFSNLVFDDD